MTDIDWLGVDGGKMALAFGAGWGTCLAFLTGLIVIAFRFVTKSHEKRLAAAEAAHAECRKDNEALKDRVKALELMLWQHGPSQIRKELGSVISELHMDVRRMEGREK